MLYSDMLFHTILPILYSTPGNHAIHCLMFEKSICATAKNHGRREATRTGVARTHSLWGDIRFQVFEKHLILHLIFVSTLGTDSLQVILFFINQEICSISQLSERIKLAGLREWSVQGEVWRVAISLCLAKVDEDDPTMHCILSFDNMNASWAMLSIIFEWWKHTAHLKCSGYLLAYSLRCCLRSSRQHMHNSRWISKTLLVLLAWLFYA